MSDDNALKDVDLAAWDVPPPEVSADELADSVIARLEGTEVGAAIPVEAGGGSRKRALLIASVAAAVIAVTIGVWVIAKGTQHAAPADGAVVADKARSIELDGAHADLEAGADVRWSRKGSVLHVEQRAGSAAWRVGTDSKLVIDAGAALASVEATGASLRVEVKPMNAADMRIAGVVASTAAAVALVTVVVYEGHVKVRDGGTQQTVIVQPGSTYTVTPAPEPFPVVDLTDDDSVVGVAPVGADQPPEVTIFAGDDVVIHDMQPPTRVKIDMSKVCNTPGQLVVNGVTTSSDMLAFNRGSMTYHVMCDDLDSASGSVVVVRDTLARPLPMVAAVAEMTADGRAYKTSFQVMPAVEVHGGPGTLHVAQGSDEHTYMAKGESVLIPSKALAAGQYKVWFTPDKMSTLDLLPDTSAPMVALQISWGPQLRIEGTVLAGSTLGAMGVQIPVDGHGRFKADLPGGSDTLVLQIAHPSAGMHYAIARSNPTQTTSNPVTVSQRATTYEQAVLSLRPKLEACMKSHPPAAEDILKLRIYVSAAGTVKSVDVQDGVEPKLDQCVVGVIKPATFPTSSNDLTVTVPIKVHPLTTASPVAPANCDADAIKDKGMENVNMGQHAAALSQFEASLRCKDDSYVRQLAYMAACNAQNTDKAKLYYSKLSDTQQKKYLVLCVRNHIDPSSNAVPAPANCDADAAKDKGMENVNMGQHAAALAQFEASLRCKEDSYVRSLAFMAACNSQNESKAKLYWTKLTSRERSSYKQMCVRNRMDPSKWPTTSTSNPTTSASNPDDLVAPSCDADALKDQGMELVNLGKHAEAMRMFEQSLACKPDSYVNSLVFMAACNSLDDAKARKYYAKLSPSQQTKYIVMCQRNNIDPTGSGGGSSSDPFANDVTTKGYLQIASKPAAKILVDGVDTGLITPVTAKKLPLAPGKHKITFVIGDDRFTYPIMIEPGKTAKMSKNLQ